MANRMLKLYYASMIIFIIGSVFVVLFGVVIEPVVGLYHEQTESMISPVFGNFHTFLMVLASLGVGFTTVSAALYAVSLISARKAGMRVSAITLLYPIALYVFSFAIIAVGLK